MKTLLLALALSACASAPAHVATPAAPANRALAAMRLNFPQADAISVGDHTAFGRDGLRVILCTESSTCESRRSASTKREAEPYASAVMNAFDQALWNVLVLPYSIECGAPFGPCFYVSPLNAAMIVVDIVTRGPPGRIVHP